MTAAVLAALLACPAGPGSRTPRLSSAPGGLVLSWQEPGPKDAALRFSRWDGKSWSKPALVARRPAISVNNADFPSVIALEGGGYAAQWIESRGEARDVRVSTSADGRAWAAPAVLHSDSSPTEHGFATLLPGSAGRFTAVWLDGRRAAKQGPQTLYAVEWDATAFGAESELDARVCDCCSTSAVLASEGLLVAYRDRTEGEVRDISVVRRTKGRWGAPKNVSGDGWVIRGCPVNGPALAAAGERVVLAWYTAAGDVPAVKAALSSDGGATFGASARLDLGLPAGRVDALMLGDGSALVSWIENGETPKVMARRVMPGGSLGAPFEVASYGKGARASGFPRLAAWGGRVIAAWSDASGEKPRVRFSVFDPLRDLK